MPRYPLMDEPYWMRTARTVGTEHGTAVGSWVVDGNTDDRTKRELVRMSEDGDPALWDLYAGPWSADPGHSPDALLRDLGLTEEEDDENVERGQAAIAAYTQAHAWAWEAEVVRSARASLPEDGDAA